MLQMQQVIISLFFSRGSVTVLQKIASYQEKRVKLTNAQLNQLKSTAKNTTVFKLNKKNSEDEELPHKLFLTTRQTSKIKNASTNNTSTDIELSKAQMSKIIQSCGSFGFGLAILEKKHQQTLLFLYPLARNNFHRLISNPNLSEINEFDRKITYKGAVRAGKVFTLFI